MLSKAELAVMRLLFYGGDKITTFDPSAVDSLRRRRLVTIVNKYVYLTTAGRAALEVSNEAE